MRSYITLAFAGLAALVAAQNDTTGGTYYIDPTSVSNSTRESWCTSQTASCPLICLQTAGNSADTEANSCDPTTLTYSCVCSNGLSPNASEFSQTLPYFICTEWGNQCVSNCGGSSACASACRDNHPCGAQSPTRINATTSSSSMSKTASSTSGQSTNSAGQTIYSGFAGTATATASGSSSGSSAASALEMGQAYGLLAMAGCLFGGFALLL